MSFQSNYEPKNWRDVVFFQLLKSRLQWAHPDNADVSVMVICEEDLSQVMGHREPSMLCSASPNVTSKVRRAEEWAPNGKAVREFVTFIGEPFRVPGYFGLLRMVPSDLQDFLLARYRARSLAKEVWSLREEVGDGDRIFVFIDPATFRVAAYSEKHYIDETINQGDNT